MCAVAAVRSHQAISFHNEKLKENNLIAAFEDFRNERRSAYSTRDISHEEMLNNLFMRIDASKLCSVLLNGSRATGRQNAYSDVDLVLLTGENRCYIPNFWDHNGTRYALQFFDSSEISQGYFESRYRFYYGMKPIYDPYGYGWQLSNQVYNSEIGACKSIPKGNILYRDRMYQLAELLEKTEGEAADFIRIKILCEYPVYLSAFNGFNLVGHKTTIDCLIRDEQELALLYADALRTDAGKHEINKLLRKSFDSPCSLNVLDMDFSHSKKSFDISIGRRTMYQLYTDYSFFSQIIGLLTPNGENPIEFYIACREQMPRLFEKIHDLMCDG